MSTKRKTEPLEKDKVKNPKTEEEKEVPRFVHVVDSIARVDTRYRFWSEFIVDPNKQKGWNNMLGK